MDNLNGYKAFEPGMICKGKQYQENTDYTPFKQHSTISLILCSWATLSKYGKRTGNCRR